MESRLLALFEDGCHHQIDCPQTVNWATFGSPQTTSPTCGSSLRTQPARSGSIRNTMQSCTDLTGRTFGRLTVTSNSELRSHPSCRGRIRYWLCLCECGNQTWVIASCLTSGSTRSCDCLARENGAKSGKACLTHGHTAAQYRQGGKMGSAT